MHAISRSLPTATSEEHAQRFAGTNRAASPQLPNASETGGAGWIDANSGAVRQPVRLIQLIFGDHDRKTIGLHHAAHDCGPIVSFVIQNSVGNAHRWSFPRPHEFRSMLDRIIERHIGSDETVPRASERR